MGELASPPAANAISTRQGRTPGAGWAAVALRAVSPGQGEKLILANRHILADQMEYLQALADAQEARARRQRRLAQHPPAQALIAGAQSDKRRVSPF